MNMRKAISLLTVILIAFSLFGCSFINRINKTVQEDPKRIEKENAVQIFEYLKNEDIESLSGLFSKEAEAKHSIRSEWESFFKRVDGKIVSYKSIRYPAEGSGKDKNGEVYDSHISVNYVDVTTDNGTVYKEFGYYRVQVSKNDPDSVGLSVFSMKDPKTGEWITVGGE